MSEIQTLRTHIMNYSRTRSVYTGYRKAGYSKKYLAEHEGDILIHKAAKYGQVTKAFQSLPIFNCQIPYTVKVGDANSYGMSVMELEQANPASLAYLELAKEVLANA